MRPADRNGLFIAFEGVDGSGKTTQLDRLARRLRSEGFDVDVTREPGGTDIGEDIRTILLERRELHDVKPRVQALLMSGARAQNVDQRIRPHLERHGIVLCDRFAASTTAYQGGGFRLKRADLQALNEFAIAGVEPDLYVLLDIDARLGLERGMRLRAKDWEKARALRWDLPKFHRRIRETYLELARSNQEQWLVVDATRTPDEIEKLVWDRVGPDIDFREARSPLARAGHSQLLLSSSEPLTDSMARSSRVRP